MMTAYPDAPAGVVLIQKLNDACCPRLRFNRDLCYRISVLLLTYLAYMCYHMARKPISVVKTVLNQNCTSLTPPSNIPPDHITNWCDWAPFDQSDASQLLGTLDSAFLFAYAVAMFASGFIAERVNLRYFLAIGMILSGIFSYLFGIARTYNIHHMAYFVVVQILAGIVQTTGWPGVISVVVNWFGKGKRGLIFGIWNSHTSLGNIMGTVIAGAFVETDWSLSFIYPGLLISVVGFLLALFLVVNPKDVGCVSPNNAPGKKSRYRRLENQVANVDINNGDDHSESDEANVPASDRHEVQRRVTERTHLLTNQSDSLNEERAIGFVEACMIPGVVEFSLSLFFSKLVNYTFLYWLPLYVKSSTTMGATNSADFSTSFDVGGIVGAIAAGVISDYSGMSATTCVGMMAVAAPMMFIYQHFASISLTVNCILLLVVGVLVNGPYALITTAVSAELGTHSSVEGNSKALATVTAIIDGTGSIGAAVGPLLAGFVNYYGWHNVFYMLIISDILALLLLLRLFKLEMKRFRQRRRPTRVE